MIKCDDTGVEFTAVNYQRSEELGIPEDVLKETQITLLALDLAHIFSAFAHKFGAGITIEMIQLAVKSSLDPREEDEDDT